MWHWLERYRGPIILLLMALLLVGGALLLYRQFSTGGAIEISLAPPQQIVVQVSGEVTSPGAYTLPSGARVADAIEAAGGLGTDAYGEGLNLAQRLWDGDRVEIPKVGEVPQKVNINTADVWLLKALPGVGEVLAQRIIDYRGENGPFLRKEDLINVSGIGEATYADLEDKITVY